MTNKEIYLLVDSATDEIDIVLGNMFTLEDRDAIQTVLFSLVTKAAELLSNDESTITPEKKH